MRRLSDDATITITITTSVDARHADNKEGAASETEIETLNGTVMLSGFANIATDLATERATVEHIKDIAMKVDGVKSVKSLRNATAARP